MDSRTWLYERLTTDAALTAIVPAASVHGAGSLLVPPDRKPFLIVNLAPLLRGPFPGVRWQDCTVWAHDEPGSYLRIDNILDQVERVLSPSVSSGDYVQTVFQGRSQDLTDDALGTITRNVALRLAIRHAVVT